MGRALGIARIESYDPALTIIMFNKTVYEEGEIPAHKCVYLMRRANGPMQRYISNLNQYSQYQKELLDYAKRLCS